MTSLLSTVNGELINLCEHCGEKTDRNEDSSVSRKKIVCDNCEQFYVYCCICDDSNNADGSDPCCHLFWNDRTGWWSGFGSDDWNEGKIPFMKMLEMTGIEFAIALHRSFLAHEYYFRFYGSIFGVEKILTTLLGEAERDDSPLNAIFEEKDAQRRGEIEAGINWLMSLEEGKTSDADSIAAGWCAEFIEARNP